MPDFRPLFGVRIEHEYVAPDPFDGLELRPESASMSLLARAGIVLRPLTDGVLALADREMEAEVLRPWLDDPARPFRVVFRLVPRASEFHLYTDLPTDRRIVRLLDTGAVVPGDGPIRLDRTPGPGEGDEVLDALAETYLTRRDELVPPVAVLVVQLTPALLDRDGSEPYRIAFAARRTIWRYHLLGTLAGVEAVIREEAPEEEEPVGFRPAGIVDHPGGRNARTLVSEAPIPVLRSSGRRLQLREEAPGNRILVRRLPVAAPEGIGIADVDGRSTLVSDIFVNS
jgi:hypothetical protein